MKISVRTKVVLLISLMLLIDQLSKFYIKLNFAIGDTIDVFSWFKITFVENNGMAFGIEFIGKLFLTLFRIAAIIFLAVFIHRLIKKRARVGYILTIALLLAGAAGNIIDSVFYGVIFSETTTQQIATFFPAGGGYAPLLYGKVVDMFYFPIISNDTGATIFFPYIFNVADSCVTVSVIIIVLFFRKELNESLDALGKKESDSETTPQSNEK